MNMKHKKEDFFNEGIKKTFLIKFLNKKLKGYDEPERKGKRKGEVIGFSRKKYAASLAMLTTDPPQQIAKVLEIPIGSIRNWCMQDSFLDLQYKHAEEFIKCLEKYTKEKFSKHFKSCTDYLDCVIDKRPPDLNWSEFIDYNGYGEILCDVARGYVRDIVKHMKENPNDQHTRDYLRGFLLEFFLNISSSIRTTPKDRRRADGDVKSYIESLSKFAKEAKLWVDNKKKLDESDRRAISEYLGMFCDGFESIKTIFEDNYLLK